MSVRGTIRGMAERANPAFAVGAVGVPLGAFVVALAGWSFLGDQTATNVHTYVHVMAGVLWTGIDLFMAMVVGPVVGGLSVDDRASFFERFTPKTSFLLPTLATVTIFGGITLAPKVTAFPHSGFWTALFVASAFLPATLLVGWVFDAFRDRRWQAFFVLVLVGSAGHLAATYPEAGMTRPIFVAILAVMAVLTVQGFGFLLPNEVLIYLEMISDDPDKERIGRLGMRNAKLSGVQGAFQLSIIVLMVYLRYGGF